MFLNFEDESLNSRNPFSDHRTAIRFVNTAETLAGPLWRRRPPIFVDFQRRETDDNELVRGTMLDPNLNPVEFGFGVVTPRRNLTFSPRIDYQLNANNTLIARYSYNRNKLQNGA
jgi:hypothetical protein